MTIIINLSKIGVRRQNLYEMLITKNIRQPIPATNHENQLIKLHEQEIIYLAGLEPEPFGSAGEKILTHHLNLLPRLEHNHDARTQDNRRIEIKCARYKTSYPYKLNYIWTRINTLPNAGYDLLLLALLTECGLKIRVLDHQQVEKLTKQISHRRKVINPQKLSIRRDDLLFFLANNK